MTDAFSAIADIAESEEKNSEEESKKSGEKP